MAKPAGAVYLVGAGPGAPDLISIRGAEALRGADVVVYDSLVDPQLLALAPGGAELIHAGRRGGSDPAMEQSEVNELLIRGARAGKRVVRLKGGDPFIFGRGGEEAEALVRARVHFEVVPGVTSATAAPAFAGIPLTHRERGSFVAFVTGHEDESKAERANVPWDELARAAAQGGTLVILMAAARLRATLERLVRCGLPVATPAAAVQWGSTAAQKTVVGTLATLATESEAAGLRAPSVVVVGDSAQLASSLGWFESMPLFGRRIVITRARDDSSQLARELRALGADAIEFPTIEAVAPDSFAQLDSAIARLGDFDWILFTSARGVDGFMARVRERGHDIREAARASIGAIGPATAACVEQYALQVAVMPSEYRAEAIVPALGPGRIKGKTFLVARAQDAREVLPEMLRAQGAAAVVIAPTYRTVLPAGAAVEKIRDQVLADAPDLVVFTSSSTVSNYCALMGRAGDGQKAAVIGPITEKTALEHGFSVVAKPDEYTIAALTDAIRGHFAHPA
ncbi:MAG: uroporphyrinogen-III C-methyltransferase [Candidatus Binataceae bacterium]